MKTIRTYLLGFVLLSTACLAQATRYISTMGITQAPSVTTIWFASTTDLKQRTAIWLENILGSLPTKPLCLLSHC